MAVMVIDTSAIAAILFDEPESARFSAAIEAAAPCIISAVTRVELACVVEGRIGAAGGKIVEDFLKLAGIETAHVTPGQADLAIEGFRRFGRGRHSAALNLGDCFSYALAKATGDTLLFKGRDFSETDIIAAI
jgi:ribonuclease VapC